MATLPIGITLPFRLGTQGYFEQSFDTVTQIKSNMTNFFLTMKGERPMNPDFGTDLYSEIFNSGEESDVNSICEAIIQSEVKQWFPIISIKQLNFNRTYSESNIYAVDVTISFTVTGILTTPTTITLSLTNNLI